MSDWEWPVHRFGVWDAPMFDDATVTEVPVPTDLVCCYCGEQFIEGDNGAITPGMGPHHRECALRSVMGGIGHHVDHDRYCRSELGPDAGLTKRQSAFLVWRLIVEKQQISEGLLSNLRTIGKLEEGPILRDDDPSHYDTFRS